MSYTDIDDSSVHFQIATWTGDGNADRAIVNDGNSAMQPDLVWYKSRSNATSNILYDSSRGADYYLKSNTAGAEGSDALMFESFDSDGFSLNGDTDGNGSGRTYVGWQWKANGGTRSTFTESGANPGGGYQVNTTAGFSIVDYTGTGSAGTISHGLTVAPDLILVKNRGAAEDWCVYHAANTSAAETDFLKLNTSAATADATVWNDTAPTTSVFSVGTDADVNSDGVTYIAYCFASKQGYSKFSSYVGNGASDAAPATLGPFIYTGFSPALVIIKKTSAADSWLLFDNKRAGYDPAVYRLYGEDTSAETGGTNNTIQFTSNGFKIRFHGGSLNESGGDYVYMAWAEQPFVTSTAIPATAR
jgi:hypothetical protein